MPDQIIDREEIVRQADAAAMRCAASGRIEANDAQPYAPDSEEGRIYAAAFQRYLLKHSSVEDCEGSA